MMTNPLETEADYPYSGASLNHDVTPSCTANLSLGVVKTASPTNYVAVGQTNADIISAINLQPVAVAVDGSSINFLMYARGVIT
jgi:hypothetical protein